MKSLNKAIDVLECFLGPESEEYIQLANLAKISRLDKSTVNRIVMTWVKRGYLKQGEKRGKYSLGNKFFDFCGLIKGRSRIRDIAMPHLIKLAQLSHESVILSILEEHFAAYNEVIPCKYPLKIAPDEGTKVPLYCTGVGKIFLAYMTESEMNDYFNNNEFKPQTEQTIVHPEYLKAQITVIRKENLASERDEFMIGISNVASGVISAEGRCVAAVGILGPSVRLTSQRMREIAPQVKKCASDISKELGYHLPTGSN